MSLVAWVLTVAGVLSALATIVRLTRALARVAVQLERAMPVLLGIATTFVSPTLEERLEAISTKLDDLHDYSHGWRHRMSGAMTKVLLKLDLDPGEIERDEGGA